MHYYKIIRIYKESGMASRNIKRGVTEEEAQKHCGDPKTKGTTIINGVKTEFMDCYDWDISKKQAKELLSNWQPGQCLELLRVSYRIVFKRPLLDSLRAMGASRRKTKDLNWELGMYGFNNPEKLYKELRKEK